MCTDFLVNGTLPNGIVFGSFSFGVFPHDRHSPGRDTTAQACRFSCFFCAAYGLLLTQTRTRCSNSASRAIAMLEKSAKISPNACGWYPSRTSAVMWKTPLFSQTIQVWSVFGCTFLLSGTPFNKRRSQQSRTANLHRLITFHNQSADLSACAGRPLADFRRLGEHSDCFENTV